MPSPLPPRRWLAAQPLALPRPLDALAERWAAMPPRARTVAAGLVIAAVVAGGEARVLSAEQSWGGPAVEALVASTDLPAGAAPEVEVVRIPPSLTPPEAVSEVADDARLAVPLPEGGVLTASHLDARGPGATLDPGVRAVPVPVEAGWGVVAGAWVDVWVIGVGDQPAERVASGAAVLALDVDDAGRATALVAIDDDAVASTTTGLALGRVVLAHSPTPAD